MEETIKPKALGGGDLGLRCAKQSKLRNCKSQTDLGFEDSNYSGAVSAKNHRLLTWPHEVLKTRRGLGIVAFILNLSPLPGVICLPPHAGMLIRPRSVSVNNSNNNKNQVNPNLSQSSFKAKGTEVKSNRSNSLSLLQGPTPVL